jgi:hypothetical protein
MTEFTTREATALGLAAFRAGKPVAPALSEAFMGRLASRVNTEFGSSLPLLKAFTSAWMSAHHTAVGVTL